MKGIDLFVKMFVFVKILSQWKEEGRILILRSAIASTSHLKISQYLIFSIWSPTNLIKRRVKFSFLNKINSIHHTNYLLPTFLDNDGKILPGNRLECLEEGINYIRKNEEAEFATINQVDSADLCREICYVVDECFHWTWNKEKSSCHLKSEILKTGFR